MSDSAEQEAKTSRSIAGRSRESTLTRINSSEQLNQRISVIPPAMRLLATSTAVVVLAALVWAVFGSVPTLVVGRGVVLSSQAGNFAIASVAAGPVLEVLVKPGDRVEAGTPIATIEQKLLSVRIENAQAEVDRLEADFALLKAANAKQLERNEVTTKRQLKAIEGQVAANNVRRDRLRELVDGYVKLRAKGMISENDFIAKQEQYDQTTLSLADAAARKILVELEAETKRDNLAELERQKRAEIDLRKAEVERLKVERAVGTSVRAPISGIIREIRLGQGDVAAAGSVVATMGPERDTFFQVVTLLEGNARKRAAAGMEAQIVPVSVEKAEFGSMKGRVISVSPQDVSEEDVDEILHHRQLTKNLLAGHQALLAYIALVPTKDNPSGFAWWSGKGPPYKITAGTVADVDIIVERERPITLVIPALRKLLSIEG